MWFVYLAAVLLAVILLYLPGFILLMSISLGVVASICVAPVASIALYSSVELLLYCIGISSNQISVGISCACILILAILFAKIFSPKLHVTENEALMRSGSCSNQSRKADIPLLALYVCVGVFAVFFFIVLPLDGPESFFQGWDNLHHLGNTKAFVDSSDWNPLFSSRYSPGDIEPYDTARSFYPSAYHVLCAAISTIIGAAVPTAINAVNTVLIGVVFATSMFFLMRTLFENNSVVLLGSIFALGTPACPWDYLIYGPLFPNLMSMVLIPICMSLFIVTMRSFSSGAYRHLIRWAICFLLGIIAVAFSHPNGIFTLILVLAPYLAFWIWDELKLRGKSTSYLVMMQGIYWFLLASVWCLCREIPAFQSIVNTTWDPIVDIPTAISNCILLNFFNHPSQPILACLFVVGFIGILRCDPDNRWILVSYIVASFVYVVDAATEGEIKQVLAGYWYTDYHRTAPIVALLALIIAALGASMVLNFIQRSIVEASHCQNDCSSQTIRRVCSCCFSALLFIVTFFDPTPLGPIGTDLQTPFGYQRQEFSNQYNVELIYYDVLTAREQEFCNRAMSIIPEGSLIINSPNDGSVFMYPLYGADIYYRSCIVPSHDSEYEASRLIRLELDEFAHSPSVQQAVREIGAEYLIQLDYGVNPEEFRINYGVYNSEDWVGIESVCEETPGFELVLSDGDMRLYKIVDSN